MPIDTGSLMLKLSPLSPINIGGGGDMGMERQRLALAREQFEYQKKHADDAARAAELTRQSNLAIQRMKLQKQQDKAAADQAQKLQEQRLAGVQKVSELAMAGNAQGALAMSPVLDMLGSGLEVQGQVDGLPRLRVIADRDAEAAKESAAWQAGPHPIDDAEGNESAQGSLGRMGSGGVGYPGDDQGTLDEPAGIGTTEDAYGRALEAQANAGEAMGLPARAPDEPDDVGGVPRDVIDMGALHSLTMRRLSPALQSATEAYTDEPSRLSAEKTAEMAAASGLPMDKALGLYNDSRTAPDTTRRTQIMADAQQDKFRETRDELTPVQAESLKGKGFQRAQAAYTNSKIGDSIAVMDAADTITDILTNPDSRDDGKVVNYLMELTHNKGHQSETDAMRVTGADEASTIEQFTDYLHKKALGGFSPELKESLLGFVESIREQDKAKVFGWLGNQTAQAQNPKTHEQVRAGYEEFRDGNIPQWLRDEYDETKKIAEENAPADAAGQGDPEALAPDYSKMSDFDLELEGQAMENGLDPDAMRAVIGPESGGSASATNPKSGATGLIQFMPSVAKSLGTSTEELAKMSPAEQLPYAIKYFKGWGLDESSPPEDYVLATAAPAFIGKPPEAVVYAKGSPAWRDNAPWRPKDGGDITVGSILKFYGLGGGGSSAPTPKSSIDAEVLDILRGN